MVGIFIVYLSALLVVSAAIIWYALGWGHTKPTAPSPLDPIAVEAHRLAEIEVEQLDAAFTLPSFIKPAQPRLEPFQFEPFVTVEDLGYIYNQFSCDRNWLLPDAPDDTHAFSPRQVEYLIGYIRHTYPSEMRLDDCAADLRHHFLTGKQKDWNIINGIADLCDQNRRRNDPMTSRQADLIFGSILPAIMGHTEHWDEDIQAAINKMDESTKYTLIQEGLKVHTRGDIAAFMAKVETIFGKPKRKF